MAAYSAVEGFLRNLSAATDAVLLLYRRRRWESQKGQLVVVLVREEEAVSGQSGAAG